MKRLFALSLVAMMGLSLVACQNEVKEDVYEEDAEVAEVEGEEVEAEVEAEAEAPAEEVAEVVAE